MVREEMQKELNDVRQELLNRPDQYITFKDLVERFDDIDAYFNHSSWNLLQIYSNFDVLIGEESAGKDCISREDLLKKCVYVPIAPVIKGDSVHYEDVVFARDIINAEPIQQEPKTDWIPVKTRSMTEEETEHYFEYTDMRIDDTYTILDCPLPDDGQEVLISRGGYVGIEVFIRDSEGCYFDGVDIDEVEAWMPLPEPYEEREG